MRPTARKPRQGAALLALGLTITGACAAQGPPKAPEVIQEDDPRWDCKTMGNGLCGSDWDTTTIINMLAGDPCKTADTGDDGVIVDGVCISTDALQDVLRASL